MTLDWTTFILEMLNFLVLVWILKHFLYKPVLAILAQRRAAIDKTLVEAKAAEERAVALQAEYEHRQADWEHEKAAAREQLATEIELERNRQMQMLTQALATERERSQAQEGARLAEQREQLEAQALAQGSQFVSAMLSRVAGPELEARLVEVFIEDLTRLSAVQLAGLRTAASETDAGALATSVFPLGEAQRERVKEGFANLLGIPLSIHFGEDPALVSGLHVVLGAWQLKLSLADELRHFVAAASHEA